MCTVAWSKKKNHFLFQPFLFLFILSFPLSHSLSLIHWSSSLYLVENIHGVLTKTLRQQLDSKLLDPTLHVSLSFGLGDSPHDLARIRSHRWIVSGTETDRPPIVIERGRPRRRLQRGAPRPVQLHLATFIHIRTVIANRIVARRLLRSLPIRIEPQIGQAPTKPSVLVIEILTGVVEFHWRFGVFFFFFLLWTGDGGWGCGCGWW